MDLSMLSYFGSGERTLSDWKLILEEADKRFEFKRAIKLEDTGYILEVVWKE